MARTQSSIGVAQYYGPKETNEGLPNAVSTVGLEQQVEVYFDWEDANAGLPSADADTDMGTLRIPANALITAAYVSVGTAWTSAGSATLELGLEHDDGSTNDADGFDSLAKAVLTANSWHVCDGALIGATVGTEDSQISIDDGTAAFTAGTGRLIVKYIPQYGV